MCCESENIKVSYRPYACAYITYEAITLTLSLSMNFQPSIILSTYVLINDISKKTHKLLYLVCARVAERMG